MVALPDHDRALLMEALWRATDELATSSPMLPEAAVLRARIYELLGQLGASPAMTPFGAGDSSTPSLRSAV